MNIYSSVYKWHLRRRGWIALDFVAAISAILASYAMRAEFVMGWSSPNPAQPSAFQAALIYPWFVLLSMHVAGLHDPLGARRHWATLLRTILANVAALGLCLAILYFVSLQQIGRTILLRTLIFGVLLMVAGRIILWKLSDATPRQIGCFMSAPRLMHIRALNASNPIPAELIVIKTEGIAESPGNIAQTFVTTKVEEVLVSAHENHRDVWMACLNKGIQVTELAVFVEREYYKVPCENIDLNWLLAIDLKWNHPFYHRFKRMMDIAVGGIGMLLSLPVFCIAGAAILLESGRPVFYSQIRVGLRSREYRLWKLRTMRADAECAGPKWASENDNRVTKIGRILRRTRIDELPQFWNVLKGEMSIIGPRPERPAFVAQLNAAIPMYVQRHWIKPGITGWAQINYPYGSSVDDAREKLCYDLYYLKNASLVLDTHIALRTIGAVMKGSR